VASLAHLTEFCAHSARALKEDNVEHQKITRESRKCSQQRAIDLLYKYMDSHFSRFARTPSLFRYLCGWLFDQRVEVHNFTHISCVEKAF